MITSPDSEAAGRNKRRTKRKLSRKAKNVDPGVLFFEAPAASMKDATGDCDALAQAAFDFKQANLAEYQRLACREQGLDAATRQDTTQKYQG